MSRWCVHPVRLVAGSLSMGLVSSFVLLLVGPLFSVSYFMVLLGGMMVVFAFSVALVPFPKTLKKVNDNKPKAVSSPGMKVTVILWRFCVFIGLCVFLSYEKSVEELSKMSMVENLDLFSFKECLYMSFSFSKLIVFLSAVLFICMVSAVRICKFHKGALVK
uniref:NADH dehydrogenase subunit 6 n=1 Tax=Raeta sp. TaxID=3067663 RepID=A0AA50AH99_9BIVA|nr:NADH dehydrogenase subunit 6 [Raeta sp.]